MVLFPPVKCKISVTSFAFDRTIFSLNRARARFVRVCVGNARIVPQNAQNVYKHNVKLCNFTPWLIVMVFLFN